MHSDFLKGVRVIGVTQVWAGPWAGGILADMGAEVIKIESKQKLDTMRCMPEGLNGAQTLMLIIVVRRVVPLI